MSYQLSLYVIRGVVERIARVRLMITEGRKGYSLVNLVCLIRVIAARYHLFMSRSFCRIIGNNYHTTGEAIVSPHCGLSSYDRTWIPPAAVALGSISPLDRDDASLQPTVTTSCINIGSLLAKKLGRFHNHACYSDAHHEANGNRVCFLDSSR